MSVILLNLQDDDDDDDDDDELSSSCYLYLTDIIQKRRLMLFGHVARMDETADARRIVTGVHQSDWRRPVGRPYTSWMATMERDLSLHNLTFEDAIELALDKSLWRLLVASGATH